ncbi:hypothetical protein NQ317_019032 [Molorchus minor]|uniref:THAP-type domain-containing protein n=1 Tax=Molorchus minor TaxID=1323400 RepID=A0ABQ9IQ83_9CUCU|nr:hypothetical protein NQ317_019032 [Molorchus minor]
MYSSHFVVLLPKRPAEDEYGYAFEGFGGDQPLPNLAYLCLSHFKPEDILISSTGSKRYLKPDAFPFTTISKISDDGDNLSMPCRPSTSERWKKGSEPHLIQSSTSLTSTASKAEEQILKGIKKKNQLRSNSCFDRCMKAGLKR